MDDTKREETLTEECFCIRNNGGMGDIMSLYIGKEMTDSSRKNLTCDLAEELIAYNKGHHASVYIEGFNMDWAIQMAKAEVALRTGGRSKMPDVWEIDDIRFDKIMARA